MAKKSIGGTAPEVRFPVGVPNNNPGSPIKVGKNSMPKYQNPPPPPPPPQQKD